MKISPHKKMRIAVDTGGTFTDCVYRDGQSWRTVKVFSIPANPAHAILAALAQIPQEHGVEIHHGTTVGTNAIIERKGARTALVTTAGFEDALAIGRQARQRLYDFSFTPPAPLVDSSLRFGVRERTAYDGTISEPVNEAELASLVEVVKAAQPESIAVSLLFSFANPANEHDVGRALEGLAVPISLSHRILPEFREYERTSTVVINAYLAPRMGRYIEELERRLECERTGAKLYVMQSSGGIIPAATASREPVRTLLSGPAGGVVGANAVARAAGYCRIISFDMGGTSTDVSLVDDEAATGPRTTRESFITGLPVGVPMLDIQTVGAGGGSLARFDSGGALAVGPESAGADPGPICYGLGVEPTVTDADLILGRMDSGSFLDGRVRLDEDRAHQIFERRKGPLARVEDFAEGIVRVADATMERALRLISIQRGHDPRDFTLVAFGGAGPLHACALARALHIRRVLVPPHPGALSALGILMSDVIKDYSRTVMLPPEPARLARHFRELEWRARREMRDERLRGALVRSADVRYQGQGFEINVAWAGNIARAGGFVRAFHHAHQRRYGYADEKRPVEVVTVRVRMIAATEAIPLPDHELRRGNGHAAIVKERRAFFEGRGCRTRVYNRSLLRPGDTLRGPAVIAEYSATTAVPPGCVIRVDGRENLVIEVN